MSDLPNGPDSFAQPVSTDALDVAPVAARVLQLRVIIEAEDFDAAMAFYRDALGLPEEDAFQGDGGARVAILDAGRATLEIANPAQKRMIDEVETGAEQPPGIRIAFEVADARGVTSRLEVAGAAVIGEPRETPWKSLNSRIESPAGQQITVFQELGASPSAPQ
jgi:predicted enzyme related to lactoylglutathione lyase